MVIYRFSRNLRLFKAADYRHVFQKPIKSADWLFTVLGRPNHCGNPRLGLIIAKKHVKTAVARNRIKRIVREDFRLIKDNLGEFDIIVLAKADTLTADSRGLRSALLNHWKCFQKLSG